MEEICYAKINLVLNVVKKLSNGYHELESIFCPIDFFDVINIYEHNEKKDIVISNVEIPGENIILKAIRLMKEKYNKEKYFYKIILTKNIFIGAGLAGGSSNAAGVIRGLNKLWKLNLTLEEMENIAVMVGADVPFCITNKIAYITGIGDNIKFIKCNSNLILYCLLINPNFSVNTKEVFENYKVNYNTRQKNNIENSIKAFKNGDINTIINSTYNDLEKVTLIKYPKLLDIKNEIEEAFDCKVQMSGSGPTLFVLSENKKFLEKIKLQYFEKFNIKLCKILS